MNGRGSTSDKVTPVYLLEAAFRAKHGKPTERPFGSIRVTSPWEKLFLNPTHLQSMPLRDDDEIDMKVKIGPKAAKPLEVNIPILISGMSFGGALSKACKIALAKAATLAGTATNSGEAGLLKEEREAADKFIGQYNRGGWLNSEDVLRKLDAVEIQLGQGAQAATPQRTPSKRIKADFQEVFNLKEGQDAVIHSRLPGVDSAEDFIDLVPRIKEMAGGIPVGLKFAATNYMERELEIGLEAGIDYVVVDGAEAGSHAAMPITADDMGLPTMPALVRTVDFLESRGKRNDVSVIAAGGLRTPGEFLKAIALGADCVYIGTIAIMALVGEQITKTIPGEPPTQLVLYSGTHTDRFDIEAGAQSLANFLKASLMEMEMSLLAMGRDSTSKVSRNDLCCTDRDLAAALGVDWAYGPSGRTRYDGQTNGANGHADGEISVRPRRPTRV